MYGSCARNGAASRDAIPVPANGRRKLLNKRRGVSPQAIICSVALCGAAFAYALSIADSSSTSSVASASVTDASAASVSAASAAGNARTDASADGATSGAQLQTASVQPRLRSATTAPMASDPRWAKDVEPVEEGFDWQGRLVLSADGQKIVPRNRQPGTANPLIESDSAARPEFAYAEPRAESSRQVSSAPTATPETLRLVDARTRSAVNMRAAGEKSASVITVVPRGAAVRVDPDCQHWCASVYEDKQGYIYKSYLSVVDMGSTASIAPQPAAAKADHPTGTARNEMRAEDYAPSRTR